MSSTKDISLALAHLARSAPKDWEQFMRAYRAYCDQITNELVSSPPDTIQVLQGRARHSREFLKLLETCMRDADQIERK